VTVAPAVVRGPDGARRCWWGASAPEYFDYHDREWGRPITDDDGLFERLCLEAFQSGLSWLTILRKREAFREAFAGFEIERVAAFGRRDVRRLLADARIVRNRRKIEAAITNARAAGALADAGGSLAALAWSVALRRSRAPRRRADLPATTEESVALARALKAHGFVFVGPTTAYATMQACGLVNDHVAGCHARAACETARRVAAASFSRRAP
jgi:DNA-3-methyladenine glycosylase I